jgi:hypothetical protein
MKVLPECYTNMCKTSMLCNCPGSFAQLVLLAQVEVVELVELLQPLLVQPVLVAPGPIAPVAPVGQLPLVALVVLRLLPLVPSLQLHLVLPVSLSYARMIKDDNLF